MQDLDPLLLHEAGQLILADVELVQLALELAVALQTLGRQPGLDGAAGLTLMPAVAEAAAHGQLLDVREAGLDARQVSFPQMQLAQPRSVDEQAARGGEEQLAMRGGMAAPVVALPHLGGLLDLAPQQIVAEGGLADARGAEQPDRPARAEIGDQLRASLAGRGAHRVNRHAHGDGLDFEQALLRIGAAVELVEDNDRLGAAVPSRRQIALDAAGVVVAVETRDEEDRVHVRGHHLLLRLMTGRLAREPGPPGKHGMDHRPPLPHRRPHRHPIPHRRIARSAARPLQLMAKLPGKVRQVLGLPRRDPEQPHLRHHPGRDEPLLRTVGLEGVGEEVGEAEVLESQGRHAWGSIAPVASPQRVYPIAAMSTPAQNIPVEQRITIDSAVCNGKPTIRGKRISVQTVLEFLSAGESREEILRQYPSLEEADIDACLGTSPCTA